MKKLHGSCMFDYREPIDYGRLESDGFVAYHDCRVLMTLDANVKYGSLVREIRLFPATFVLEFFLTGGGRAVHMLSVCRDAMTQ